MITVFGASGYTGSRIAAVLDREGMEFRIAGRSAGKLKQLSEKLPSHPQWLCADAMDPTTLPGLFRDTRLLINCVGPFTDLGEKVLSLAAVSGVHYLDTTNELGFVYRAQTFDSLACRSKAVLIPACGFEVALADCALQFLYHTYPGNYSSATVVYHLPGSKPSRGTRLSMIRTAATSWLAYRNGIWQGQLPMRFRRRFHLSQGEFWANSIPSSESVTLPRHIPVKTVETWMTGSAALTLASQITVPLFARALRGLVGRAVLGLSALHQDNDPGLSNPQAPFEIQSSINSPVSSRQVTIQGIGAYEITAEIVAFAAKSILQNEGYRYGILSPAQCIDAAGLFEHLSRFGTTLTLPKQ